MEIKLDHRVEICRKDSEKALVRIDNLNEAEAKKVFENITFPAIKTYGEYDKVLIWNEMTIRRKEL